MIAPTQVRGNQVIAPTQVRGNQVTLRRWIGTWPDPFRRGAEPWRSSGARRQAFARRVQAHGARRVQMPGAGVVRCQTPGNKRLVSKENRSQGQTHKTAIISDVANCTCEADTSESCRHSITISPVARRVERWSECRACGSLHDVRTKESEYGESQSGVAFDRILIAHGT